MKRAIYGEGNYQLAPAYHSHQVARIIWNGKTQNEKDALFTKFLRCKPKQRNLDPVITSSDGNFKIPKTQKLAKKPGQRKRPRNAKTKTVVTIRYFSHS